MADVVLFTLLISIVYGRFSMFSKGFSDMMTKGLKIGLNMILYDSLRFFVIYYDFI